MIRLHHVFPAVFLAYLNKPLPILIDLTALFVVPHHTTDHEADMPEAALLFEHVQHGKLLGANPERSHGQSPDMRPQRHEADEANAAEPACWHQLKHLAVARESVSQSFDLQAFAHDVEAVPLFRRF